MDLITKNIEESSTSSVIYSRMAEELFICKIENRFLKLSLMWKLYIITDFEHMDYCLLQRIQEFSVKDPYIL